MTTAYKIPLKSVPQKLNIELAGELYRMTTAYNNYDAVWYMYLYNADGGLLVTIPLVAGLNLLYQHQHLGVGGALAAVCDAHPLDSPSLSEMGVDGNVYFIG
jgi:hypothetical protein